MCIIWGFFFVMLVIMIGEWDSFILLYVNVNLRIISGVKIRNSNFGIIGIEETYYIVGLSLGYYLM